MQDILYKQEGLVFSLRVGGLVVQDGKALLQRPAGSEEYAVIGGHVQALETAEEALHREFREELRAHIRITGLAATGELFFPWGQRTCHQIALYYRAELCTPGDIPGEGVFRGVDEMGRERFNLEYLWVPLSRLEGLALYPPQIKPLLRGEAEERIHFVYKE